jgi:hypothetical protein
VRREIFEKILKKRYPEQRVQIISYEILEKNKYENNEWVLDTPAVFVEIRCDKDNSEFNELTKFLFDFTGYEFSIR